MYKTMINAVWTTFFCIAAALIGQAAFCAEISIPARSLKAGESVQVPIMIDEVDNLAGIKIVIKYDTARLEFKEAKKTRETSSLMHIVNDRNPGTLILVMAGAVGIKGKDFPILEMRFGTSPNIKCSQCRALIDITEVQLMSDQLKNIPYSIVTNPISITAADSKASSPQAEPKAEPAGSKPVDEIDTSGSEKPHRQ